MTAKALIAGGLAASVTVTAVHQILKAITSKSPRMDLLGMEVLDKGYEKAGADKPSYDTRYWMTMAGDIVSNAAYYSLAGAGGKKGLFAKGGLLGALAGIGALVLPKPMGLNPAHSNRTKTTKLLSVGLYLLGGLVSSAVTKAVAKR